MANDGKVTFLYTGDTSGIDKANAEAKRKLEKGGEDATSSAGAAWGKVFLALGTAAAVAGAAVVKVGAEFEERISGIRAVSGATVDEMQRLQDAALQAGADTSYSASEAALAIEELIKAGLTVEQVLGGGLAGALDLAAAGEVGLAEAAVVASTVLNAFRDDSLSVADAANILAGAANASATDISGMSLGLSQVSAVASGMGLSFQDTAVALAVFAQNGLKGSDAGTSLKTMLMNLQPTTAKQIDLMTELGLYTEATGSAFYNAEGQMRPLNEIAGLLNESMSGLTDAQRSLALETIFGSDALRAGNVLFKEGADGVNAMWDAMSNVTAAEVAATRLDNLKGSVEMLTGSLETIAIGIYTDLAEPLRAAVDGIGEAIDGMAADGFFDELGKTIGQLAGTISQTLIAILPTLISLINTLLPPLMTIIQAVLPVITSLLTSLMPVIESVMAPIADAISTVLPPLMDSLMQIITPLTEIASTILPVLGQMLATIIPYWAKLAQAIFPVIADVLDVLAPLLGEIAEAILPAFQQYMATLVPIMTTLIGSILPPLVSIIEALLPPIMELVSALLPPLMSLFSALAPIIASVTSIVGPLIQIVAELVSMFMQNLMPIIQEVAKMLTGTLTGALNAIAPYVENVIGVFRNLIDFIVKVFKGDWEGAWKSLVAAFQGIINLIPQSIETVVNGAISVLNGLIGFVNSVLDKLGIAQIKAIGTIDITPGNNAPTKGSSSSGNISKGGGTTGFVPSLQAYATGLEYVPYDRYLMLADKGEMVLTADAARHYRALRASGEAAAAGYLGETGRSGAMSVNVIVRGDVSMDGRKVGEVVLENIDDVVQFMIPRGVS